MASYPANNVGLIQAQVLRRRHDDEGQWDGATSRRKGHLHGRPLAPRWDIVLGGDGCGLRHDADDGVSQDP